MSAAPLTAETVFRRSPKASGATVDDLVVLLNVDAGNYHGLNAVGSHIWAFLAEPRSVGEITADLPHHFDVAAADAEQATRAFLLDLSQRDLVERVTSDH